ncbi:hypothetical protein [Helicobacter sp. 23-1045]
MRSRLHRFCDFRARFCESQNLILNRHCETCECKSWQSKKLLLLARSEES